MLVVVQRNIGLSFVNISNLQDISLLSSVTIEGALSVTELTSSLLAASGGDSKVIIVDISNPKFPRVLDEIDTPGEAKSILRLPEKPNTLLVADANAGITFLESSSFCSVWEHNLPVQRVGQYFSQQIFVYSLDPVELLTPNRETVFSQQISSDGNTHMDIPPWLNIIKETLNLNV